MTRFTPALRIIALAGVAISLGACDVSRLTEIGKPPALSKIDNPTEMKDYRPVSLPMPAPEVSARSANSLWRPGSRQFFKDHRAAKVGDILTVNIDIQERATLQNNTTASREGSEISNLTNLLGLEAEQGVGTVATGAGVASALNKVFKGINPASVANLGSTSELTGRGQVDRQEQITVKVAGVVTQVLPNGNLVVQGRQEIRVNNEIRELVVQGIVRPEDITATNTVAHTQMAEARIAYGGRGQLSNMQQARYGTQLYDALFPF
jgi:flagellar L-ring protein precursor FlgH